MSVDMVITGVILAGASVWAGRRLWRAARPKPVDGDAPGCAGGCSSCPVGDLRGPTDEDRCTPSEHRKH